MQPPRTARLLPWIFPLLAALGVALAIRFGAESTPTAALDVRFDRGRAAEIAAEFLKNRGDDPADRWSTVSYRLNADAQSYLLRETGRDTLNARAEADLDLGHWQVRFWRPLDPDEWTVWVSPRSGRVFGFHHAIRAEQPGATLPISAAQALAEAALPVPAAGLTMVARTSETQPGRVDHNFTWERTDLRDGEARYRYGIVVEGDQVGSVSEYYWLPDSWWREGAWQGRRGGLLSIVGWTLTYAMTALIGFTWLLIARRGRLRRRWATTLFAAVLVVGALVMLNSIPIDLANYNVNESLPAYLLRQFSGYLGQLITVAATIVLAGMAGEALVWERTAGAVSMGLALTKRGLASRPVVQALLVGGLIGVFQLGFVSAFYALGGRWFGVWSPVTALYDDTLSTPFPALYALALGLLPAVGEELLFRLGGITVLTRWTGKPRLAVVATAIVWASLHSTYPQRPFFIRMLELSIIGVIFGALFVRYGVLASMAAHFTYNASLYVPLFWGGSVLYLLSGILAAGAVALLLIPALVRRLRGRPLEPDSTLALPLPPAAAEPADLPASTARRYPWRSLAIGGALALAGLLAVGWNLAPPQRRPDTRQDAIARAAAASKQLGVDLGGLQPSVQAVADWVDLDLAYLYDTLSREEADAVVRTGHARSWMVRWSAWDRTDSWQIDLGPTGQVLAYRRVILEDAPGATIPLTAAQALATAALGDQIDLAQYELLDAGSIVRSARTDHTFTWQTRAPVVGAQESPAYRRIDVEVDGDRVVALTPSMYTPPAYRRERDQTTIANSILDTLQGGLINLPMLVLPLIGLIGVLRRATPVKPWATLGLVAGLIWLLLGIGRLSHAQISELPRLIEGLCWALIDAVLNGGKLALLAAGAATAWAAGARRPEGTSGSDLPPLESQALALVTGWRRAPRRSTGGVTYRFQANLLGWLLVPWILLFVSARSWPGPKAGLYASPGPFNAAAPALDTLGRALLSATTTTLLLAGAWGGLAWLMRWRRGAKPTEPRRLLPPAAALWIAALGLVLAAVNIHELSEVGLALIAWPVVAWLGGRLRGNLLAVWWALAVAKVLPAGLALVGAYAQGGTLRPLLEGGLLLLGLAASLGWVGGRGIEQRAALDAPADGALTP